MQITREEQTLRSEDLVGLPKFVATEEQALATFNDAAEQRRFITGHQWRITNYALLAMAAIATVPSWVKDGSLLFNWRSCVSLAAFLLVWGVALLTLIPLWKWELILDMQLYRQRAARRHLQFLHVVNNTYPRKKRSKGTDRGPRLKRILTTAVIIGAFIASLIPISHIQSVQHVLACIGITGWPKISRTDPHPLGGTPQPPRGLGAHSGPSSRPSNMHPLPPTPF